MQAPPPDLPDAAVLDAVRRGWVPGAAAVRHLPVGYGSQHWVVTDTGGTRWFVSADRVPGADDEARLAAAFGVAATLREAGVVGVHGPVPDVVGEVLRRVGPWCVSVQPWLEGEAGRFSDPWSEDEARALVALLARVHAAPTAGMPREDTVLGGSGAAGPGLAAALEAVEAGRSLVGGPLAAEVGRLLAPAAAAVRRAVASAAAAPEPPVLVVTHGEPHPGNVVRTPAGPVLVDWDTARVAEPERDLWLVAGRTSLDVPALYRELTGRPVDSARMRARARAWALADVAAYVTSLSAAPGPDADTGWQLEGLASSLRAL